MKTLLAAIWFALGCTPELAMLADVIAADVEARSNEADASTCVRPGNVIWCLEFNRYGTATCPNEQYIFWSSPGVCLDWTWTHNVDTRPTGSPWTFTKFGKTYTVYYDQFAYITSRKDRERENYKIQPERKGLTPDR